MVMAGRATRATDALDRAGAAYRVYGYDVAEKVGEGYGEAVAAAIGMPGNRVFKTLVAEVDGDPVLAVIPVERRLSTKKLARAVGGKRCSLASPETAERVTGYVTGGISPFGPRHKLRLILDRSAAGFETIAVSGGQRGIQLELSPEVLVEVTEGALAAIADD
ncbi:MAG: Cys-tRNA(Pro) deacylase [Acidimicrobiia bacterium]